MNLISMLIGFISQIFVGIPTSAALEVFDEEACPLKRSNTIGFTKGIAAGTSLILCLANVASRDTLSTMVSLIKIDINPYLAVALVLSFIGLQYLTLKILPTTLQVANTIYSKLPMNLLNFLVLISSVIMLIVINKPLLAVSYIGIGIGLRFLILKSGANQATSLSLMAIIPVIGVISTWT